MKKLLIALSLGLACTPFAHADNRLFPTDILNKGEVDAQISFDHQNNSGNVSSGGNPGTISLDYSFESIQARYGLGGNWQVAATLNDNPKNETQTDFSSPQAHFLNNSNEGRKNPTLSLKYGIINDKGNPFSFSGAVHVSPNTTNTASSYSADLTAGMKTSDVLKFYGTYTFNTSRNSNAPNSQGVTVGAYYDILQGVTLIPHIGYSRTQASYTFSATSQSSIGLSSDIQLFHNTYLIPNIAHYRDSSGDTNDGSYHRDSVSGHNVSLALYQLF